ncbi:MAG: hypothetical protein PHI35_03605, partial [Victivallaceae bacterium]|nr:hypothetical protein [Victivallaceae bacterium]
MLSSKYALIGGLLLGLAAYADEFPGYEPPFKASSSLRKTVTTCVPGKAVTCFQGSGMSLKFFLNGTPNWFSPDQKMRYGAITADFNGKTLNGVRSAGENQKVIQYTYPELPGLKFDFSLRDDGLVNASLGREEGLTGCELKMIFIGEFFGGSVIKIDNKSFAQPPYRADASFYKKLFDGSASELTFFAERPDKTVTVKFAAPVKLTLASTGGRYTVWIGVKPAAGAKSIDFVINPGSVEVAADNTPVGVTTKVGRYDFWKEDRLRLPYRGDKNLLSNNSFEQGWSYLWQTHIGGGVYSQPLWDTKPLAIDDKEAFDGSHSLRILSDRRRAGLTTHIAVHPVILTPGTYTVSLYAKTDKPGKQQLMLDNLMMPPGSSIFDAKIHDVKKIDLSGEWTRYSHTFKIEVTQPHYFSFSASSNEPANCHIDAIQLEAGDHATDYEPTPVVGKLTTSAEDNLLATGAQADAKLEITTGQPQVRGEVETIVRDFFGRKIRSQKNSFTTDDKGRAAVALDFEKMPRGIFTIENRYQLNNGKGRYEFFRFAVMDFLDNTHKHKNLFANAYIDMFSTSQNYREVLERYRRIGIGSRGAYADTEELVAKESAKYGIESFSTMLLRGDRNLVKGMEKPSFGFTVLNNIVWYACLADDFQRQDYATITLPFSDPAKLKAIEDAAARRAKEAPWVKAWGAINEAEGSIPEFANSRFATEERYRQYVELELAVARGIKRGNPNTM